MHHLVDVEQLPAGRHRHDHVNARADDDGEERADLLVDPVARRERLDADVRNRRPDRVGEQRRHAEDAERLRPALRDCQLRRHGRCGGERRGEAHPLNDAQREERRADRVHGEKAECRRAHRDRAGNEEAPAPEAVDADADERKREDRSHARCSHHQPDGRLRAAERLHVQRQQEERREVQEEDEVRDGDWNALLLQLRRDLIQA